MMIKEFKGAYKWLSNFYPVEIILDGITYPSVEHAYMSAKSESPAWKYFCSCDDNGAGVVKRRSRSLSLSEDWDERKIDVMRTCLFQKFYKEPFRTWLLETGEAHIQEGNTWGDEFWGVCLKTGKGKNQLGAMIMEIREGVKKM
jgi:ribA/ribD-fused uncharacterized protein